ncbi:MAG: hypothetical protein JSR79_04060 [Proteobacteria bacterium]|nr:hypothetical protein [Pseudomonadota bacterium]
MRCHIVLLGLILASASGCDKTETNPDPAAASNTFDSFDNLTEEDSAAPTPNYSEREGDRYFYVSAVSEEDQKKGVAVGSVSQYRYLGSSNGVVELQEVTESGQIISTIECRTPCRVLKITTGGTVARMPYNPQSIAGSAMEDAINGFLTPAKGAKNEKEVLSALPANFVGTWNEELADCGTGNNDTAMVVKPDSIRFYESTATVERVTMQGRAAMVSAILSGEGASEKTTIRMTISADGEGLTIGGLTRLRCPAE